MTNLRQAFAVFMVANISTVSQVLADPGTRALQLRLAQEGHYSMRVDGRFGPGTTRAIEAYAAANEISVDEVVRHMAATARARQEDVTDQDKNTVQRLLDEILRDATTARVEFDFAYTIAAPDAPAPERVVCGRVNATNAYGGYTGFQPFMATSNLYDDKLVPADLFLADDAETPCLFGTSWIFAVRFD